MTLLAAWAAVALALLYVTGGHGKDYITSSFLHKHYEKIPPKLTTGEILARFNYSFALHKVKTADDYVIQVHHVYGSPKREEPKKSRVMLLIPGLYCQSYFYFILPDKSLGFRLPDKGYDTWVADYRGQSEAELVPHPDGLGPHGNGWEFSQDDLAKYDIPALIDFILDQTGAESLTIVGHSMGNTASFMMLSQFPEYNTKVDLLIALGPAVYVTPKSGAAWINAASPIARFVYMLANTLHGFQQLQVSGQKLRDIAGTFCPTDGKLLPLCRIGADKLFGTDPNIAKNVLPVILSHFSSASFMCHYQYFQHTDTGRFAHFDFGPEINLKKYGVPIAPLYDLRKITSSVALISGWDDKFNNIYNVRYLMRNIPKVILNRVVPKYHFNHFSFVAAKDLDVQVNDYIYELISEEQQPAHTLQLLQTKLLSPNPDSMISTVARKLQDKVQNQITRHYDWYPLPDENS